MPPSGKLSMAVLTRGIFSPATVALPMYWAVMPKCALLSPFPWAIPPIVILAMLEMMDDGGGGVGAGDADEDRAIEATKSVIGWSSRVGVLVEIFWLGSLRRLYP